MTTTVQFNSKTYAATAARNLPQGAVLVDSLGMNELTSLFNEVAGNLGKKAVNRFADRTSGTRRTWGLLQEYSTNGPADAGQKTKKIPAPRPPAKAEAEKTVKKTERKMRGPRFVFPAFDEIKPVREGTHRAKLVELLSQKDEHGKLVGATFEECMAATWGKNKDMSAEIQRKTTYEGIRLVHYWVGYGMKHNMETGKITIHK